MTTTDCLVLILAAGKGTRMKSDRPKVLHALAGRSMLGHVMALAGTSGAERLAVVIGPDMDDVRAEAVRHGTGAQVFVQENQMGTADAVLAARDALEDHDGDVLVLYGDTPLIRAETLAAMRKTLANGADVAVLGFHAEDPTGYGRLLLDDNGNLVAIREDKEASDEEKAVAFCNSGVLGFRGAHLLGLLERIGNDNAKGEYYLTDAVALARAGGLATAAIECPEEEVLGINSRAQLAEAEAIIQNRLREQVMAEGATLIDPETVWLAFDTTIGRDVVIEPNVYFGPGVTIGDGVTIKGFSHIEAASIAENANIGPYARLRPGADIGKGAKVGNFVEIKKAVVEEGAKVNHLTYIGDARVGAGANIGAGTITCNYDGFNKHLTDIGAGAFIGSNSSLIAPVKIGDGAYIGSGSVISRNVAAGALALTRPPQTEKPDWAARFRALMERNKRKKA